MPYNFHCVNATYANAYAFPGGSIAATRGILLALDNEAELAALLGHELGHVNARHTARQMTQGDLDPGSGGRDFSRCRCPGVGLWPTGRPAGHDRRRGAFGRLQPGKRTRGRRPGLEYMVRAGYGADGFVGLMDILRGMSRRTPGAIELMFATHPMSDERYQTAVAAVHGPFAAAVEIRFTRNATWIIRPGCAASRGPSKPCRRPTSRMGKKNYGAAGNLLDKALKIAPDDYAALVMMAKCQTAMNRPAQALRYAERAKQVYPQEAQASSSGRIRQAQQKDYDGALADFNACRQALPGNPNTAFFQGLTLEGMQRREQAARAFHQYLQSVRQGDRAQYAYGRWWPGGMSNSDSDRF